jgi:hypothetical protein
VKPDLSELAHHGVKGMKWGVRRGSLRERARGAVDDSFQRRIEGNRAIATGNAKARDRLRSAVTTPTGIIPSKTIAARRVRILEDRRARFSEGNATARDILAVVGHAGTSDLFISRRDKRGADVADTKNVKQYDSVHAARKDAGEKFTEGKKQAELMQTKLSDARKDRRAQARTDVKKAAVKTVAVSAIGAGVGIGLGKAIGG